MYCLLLLLWCVYYSIIIYIYIPYALNANVMLFSMSSICCLYMPCPLPLYRWWSAWQASYNVHGMADVWWHLSAICYVVSMSFARYACSGRKKKWLMVDGQRGNALPCALLTLPAAACRTAACCAPRLPRCKKFPGTWFWPVWADRLSAAARRGGRFVCCVPSRRRSCPRNDPRRGARNFRFKQALARSYHGLFTCCSRASVAKHLYNSSFPPIFSTTSSLLAIFLVHDLHHLYALQRPAGQVLRLLHGLYYHLIMVFILSIFCFCWPLAACCLYRTGGVNLLITNRAIFWVGKG